ncbi:MAG: phospholipase D-like domain-containing protein [Gemmatimonadaceae bacterium]
MIYVFWAILALPFLILAAIGLRYLVRGTPVSRVRMAGIRGPGPLDDDAQYQRSLQLLCHIPFTDGNHVELLTCGDETYPRLFADLSAARHTITLQMYYCQPGQLADQLHEVLVERARAGVRVLFLWDAFGSHNLSDEYRESLVAAGVNVAIFRPVEWWALEKAYNRSHIRVVAIDGRLGYTGGFGVDDKWLGDGRSADHWRDTNVRFAGPAVAALQATFAAGWAEATGDLLTERSFFDLDGDGEDDGDDSGRDDTGGRGHGGVTAGVMHAAPTIGSTAAERFLALAITGARHRLYISNAYFVPDDDFCVLLGQSARRGVDVRILVPGEKTDVRSTRLASRARYEQLLRSGVRMYEYQPTMMHAKTIVADGCVGSVGTMNIDNRSLAFNDESNFVFLDERVGRDLQEVFEQDLLLSTEIELATFLRRPWTERLQERFFSAIARIL